MDALAEASYRGRRCPRPPTNTICILQRGLVVSTPSLASVRTLHMVDDTCAGTGGQHGWFEQTYVYDYIHPRRNGPHPAQRHHHHHQTRLLHHGPLCFACFAGRTTALSSLHKSRATISDQQRILSPPKHFQSWNTPKHKLLPTTTL